MNIEPGNLTPGFFFCSGHGSGISVGGSSFLNQCKFFHLPAFARLVLSELQEQCGSHKTASALPLHSIRAYPPVKLSAPSISY